MDRSDGYADLVGDAPAGNAATQSLRLRHTAPTRLESTAGQLAANSQRATPTFDIARMARPLSTLETGLALEVPEVSQYAPALQIARRVLRYAAIAFAGWLALVLALIMLLRFVDPPFSAHMAGEWLSGQPIHHKTVRLENISLNAVRAVLLSEDGRFCDHYGVDFDEMQAAIDRARDGIPRGASTISMQLTKNLFLWSSKSYIRKTIEIPLTFVIEALWSKRRIMEVYMNVAEWGPGIFGVEAAARYHFEKSAAQLSEREAAQLAVALPNPIQRDAGDPGPQTRRLAGDIQARMRAEGWHAARCVATRVRSAQKR